MDKEQIEGLINDTIGDKFNEWLKDQGITDPIEPYLADGNSNPIHEQLWNKYYNEFILGLIR